jgi:hypothetical protein
MAGPIGALLPQQPPAYFETVGADYNYNKAHQLRFEGRLVLLMKL